MPAHLRHNLAKWRELHPEWDLTLWGDDDLGWLENRDLYDDAANYVPADAVWQFRSDLARYEILNRYAGLYVDCDVTPLRNIEPALEGHDAFAVAETLRWVGNTILYVDRPRHPVIKRILGDIRRNVTSLTPPKRRASLLTGPRMITSHWRAKGCYEAPTKLFFPLSYTDARAGREVDVNSLPPETYTVHRFQHVRDLMHQRRK